MCNALCMVVWDVVTAAAHAVNEMCEWRFIHSWKVGGGSCRALTGVLCSPGVFGPEL